MAFDRRGYYYRSRRIGNRVTREYFSNGPVADLIAEMDRMLKNERAIRRKAWCKENQIADDLEAMVQESFDRIDVLAKTAMIAAGYHQHRGSEWRRKRK